MCYDGDGADVFKVKRLRSRRPRVCNECRAPIPRGAEYVRVNCLQWGGWTVYSLHWECMELWEFMVHDKDACPGSLMLMGGLEEELLNDYSEPPTDDEGVPTGDPTLLDIFNAIRTAYEHQHSQ